MTNWRTEVERIRSAHTASLHAIQRRLDQVDSDTTARSAALAAKTRRTVAARPNPAASGRDARALVLLARTSGSTGPKKR